MNKNLYAAQRFFQDCFGAICFYNQPQDGYLALGGGRQMETLAIYFSNKLDLEDAALCSRLKSAAGEDFYEKYKGANGRLCGINGCKIMASFSVNNKTVVVKTYGAAALKGNIQRVIDYFCGYELVAVDRATCDIVTNNGFAIKSGTTFKDIADNFLALNGMPPLTQANGYFVCPHEEINLIGSAETIRKPDSFVARDTIRQYFPESRVDVIAAKRQKDFEKLFDKLTKEEWHAYLRDMHVSVFDRTMDERP